MRLLTLASLAALAACATASPLTYEGGERTCTLPRRMRRLGTDLVEEGACRLDLKHGDGVM
jgi:hypothetical protein